MSKCPGELKGELKMKANRIALSYLAKRVAMNQDDICLVWCRPVWRKWSSNPLLVKHSFCLSPYEIIMSSYGDPVCKN